MAYQYNYDADGKPVGVFVPINEWKIITNRLKKTTTASAGRPKTKMLKSIKKGIAQVKLIENKKLKSIPLQKLLDEL